MKYYLKIEHVIKHMTLTGHWYEILSNNFQFLNNITLIFTHFFIHTFLKRNDMSTIFSQYFYYKF